MSKVVQPAKATLPNKVESEEKMQTSLQGIAEKSALRREHRFQSLMNLFTLSFLLDSWRLLNKRSAPGVDRVDAAEYGVNLKQNIENLIERLKRGGYHAKLILRRYIPKGGGKVRPLGIPATEDKLLQAAAARILAAIYEPIFLKCSYGYRPQIGALDAVKELSRRLQFYGYNFIVEADIRSFFDRIEHDKLMDMLRKKIDDRRFMRLIRKWLNAGVLEKGKVISPISGTPQGGIISPILANIYLHYVLDEWFYEVDKSHCRGMVYLFRYADDFVCAFQCQDDAERFYKALGLRLDKFGLSLAEEKTRIIRFSRKHMKDGARFEFLGFEFRWIRSRKGKPQLCHQTSKKKFRASLKGFGEWCKASRNMKMTRLFEILNAKLRGYYNYYGVRGNYNMLAKFFYHAVRMLHKWLNRRSQRRSYSWKNFNELLKHFKIERPRIRKEKRVKQRLLFPQFQSA